MADGDGNFTVKGVPKGATRFVVSCLGYATTETELDVRAGMGRILLYAPEDNLKLESVVVTAKEAPNAMATARTIGGNAIDHLQMVNASDISSLLPGGKTINPDLTKDNVFSLRSGGSAAGNASFGTAVEVDGVRIGVIGLGNVGSKVANACVDLGMDVYGYDPFISVEHAWVLSREVQRVGTLEDLCRGCDYLTVHVPSKADTIGMISTEQINLLAPNAVLINYARETIIDEDAVDAALREGKLSWFSCDFATPKTVKMPNTFITTHSGAGTGEAEANCADMAISELKDYLENGNIAHSVNYPACSMGKALSLIHI